MNLCFVHEEYPPETNYGGIATYQKIVAEYFANHGDNVTVIAAGKKNRIYIDNKVKVIRIAHENNHNLIEAVKYRKKVAKVLLKLQKNNKIDLIETPDWGANTIFFERYRKVPIVVRLHTPLKIWLNYNKNDFGLLRKTMLNWENKMMLNSDTLSSCSSLLKNEIVNNYDINKDIIVIGNPAKKYNEIFKNECDENSCIFVGSLEQRKGSILLAYAINIVLSKRPNTKFIIVGKDTNRNVYNMSTKMVMNNIIKKDYHDRVVFVGQVPNDVVHYYLAKSKVAIFPSLFDNYPYAILEAMSLGKHIVCSNNIGLVDLVRNDNYIFESANKDDLACKIMLALNNPNIKNYNNVEILNKKCCENIICKKYKEIYKKTIEQYNYTKKDFSRMEKIMAEVCGSVKISKILKDKKTFANCIYYVFINKNKYVVKKYNYDYDFSLCKLMYDVYDKNNVPVVKPLNNLPIVINREVYNVFEYVEHKNDHISDDFLIKLLKVNRKTTRPPNLIKKCDKYYRYLNSKKVLKLQAEKDIINVYKEVRRNRIFKHNYLNHGDLSKSNILSNKKGYYVIDFDEALVTTELYDFAVIMVKLKAEKSNFNNKKAINFIKKVKGIFENKYKEKDFIDAIIMYLCKILLEKFYLYEIGKIDVFSSTQKKDYYKYYVDLLNSIKK